MNLNMNPKTLHFLLEVVQIAGAVGTAAGLVGKFYPPAAIGAAVATAVATAIKPFTVGNVPPSS